MRTIAFYNSNKSDNLLHIETEGGIVNIRVGLSNAEGKKVTSVEILPDSEYKLDGYINNRIIEK